MKILITGANGFIGSFLIQKLNSGENTLFPTVRKLPEHFKYWREKFNIIQCDITDLDSLLKSIPEIDCIIHLASANDIICRNSPNEGLIINGIGTRNMLTVAKQRKCRNFIYFSTLQVYGKELEGIYSINSRINAHNDYAISHYTAELYCKMFSNNFNMNISILRPSNIINAPIDLKINRWTLVPMCFCEEAFDSNQIVLKSSGKQMRDIIDLEIVLESVEFLLKNIEEGFNIFNITSEENFSIASIAEMVQEIIKNELNKEVDIIYENDFPYKSNNFRVINNLIGPVKREIMREKILREISKIIRLLKNK